MKNGQTDDMIHKFPVSRLYSTVLNRTESTLNMMTVLITTGTARHMLRAAIARPLRAMDRCGDRVRDRDRGWVRDIGLCP